MKDPHAAASPEASGLASPVLASPASGADDAEFPASILASVPESWLVPEEAAPESSAVTVASLPEFPFPLSDESGPESSPEGSEPDALVVPDSLPEVVPEEVPEVAPAELPEAFPDPLPEAAPELLPELVSPELLPELGLSLLFPPLAQPNKGPDTRVTEKRSLPPRISECRLRWLHL